MRQATHQIIYELLDDIAPFETQEEFDNAGFLVGNREGHVKRVLIALDVTPGVVREALQLQAQLIISHHPLMFRGTKRLLVEDYEGEVIGRLMAGGLSLISAHTNLDRSPLSASLLIARLLGLQGVSMPDPYIAMGALPGPLPVEALGRRIAEALQGPVRAFGPRDKQIKRLAIAGGAYDEGYLTAREAGADAFLTGEVRHHNALAAGERGFVLFDGGHHQTEAPMMAVLRDCLQSRLDALQYGVEVYLAASPAMSAGYAL